MEFLDRELGIRLLTLVPYALFCVGVLVAVFGKAYRDFPYQPYETKVFKKHALPRSHLFCFRSFDSHRAAAKRRSAKTTHEDADSQRPRRHRG